MFNPSSSYFVVLTYSNTSYQHAEPRSIRGDELNKLQNYDKIVVIQESTGENFHAQVYDIRNIDTQYAKIKPEDYVIYTNIDDGVTYKISVDKLKSYLGFPPTPKYISYYASSTEVQPKITVTSEADVFEKNADGMWDKIETLPAGETTFQPANAGTFMIDSSNMTKCQFGYKYMDPDIGFIFDESSYLDEITDASYMFARLHTFNANLDTWDTSKVTNMAGMFYQAKAFNGKVDTWNTSNVTDMNGIFQEAVVFNQALTNWSTQRVSDLSYAFADAWEFDQPIGNWQTYNVTTLQGTFASALVFNQSLNSWNTQKVTTLLETFRNAQKFNSPVFQSTYNVTNMSGTFFGASEFNQSLSSWNTSKVTSFENLFNYASAFNSDTLVNWNTSNVVSIENCFAYSGFNGNVSKWNLVNLTEAGSTFLGASVFNGDVSNWNVSNVTNTVQMFYAAHSFNTELNDWDVGNAENMAFMFYYASSFNQKLDNWNTEKTSDMNHMFARADEFDQDISSWCVSLILNKPDEFDSGAKFENQADLQPQWGTCPQPPAFEFTLTNNWQIYIKNRDDAPGNISLHGSNWRPGNAHWHNISQGTYLLDTAHIEALQFRASNSTLSNMYVHPGSSIGTSEHFAIAENCANFNQDISWIDVSGVKNFYRCFYKASSFNQPLFNWDVSNATTLNQMFTNARTFNQDLGSWDVSNVEIMSWTLDTYGPKSFFNVANWCVPNVTNNYRFGVYGDDEPKWGTCPVPPGSAGSGELTLISGSSNLQITGNIEAKKEIIEPDGNKTEIGPGAFTYTAVTAGTYVIPCGFMTELSFAENAAQEFTFGGDFDTRKITNMSSMFANCRRFWGDVSMFNTSNVTNMSNMFRECKDHNCDMDWDTSKVENMAYMFYNCRTLRRELGTWDTSNVSNMEGMFNNCQSFQANLSQWCVTKISSLPHLFATGSNLTYAPYFPNWGTCPRGEDAGDIESISGGSAAVKSIGGALHPNGKVYTAGYGATAVIEIDPENNSVSSFGRINGGGGWGTNFYAGTVLGDNGKLYGIPNLGMDKVVEIDPDTKTISFIGPSYGFGTQKWSGGVRALNGKIYGIPSRERSVLEIDPSTGSVSTWGTFTDTSFQAYQGGVLGPDGKIYCIPFDGTRIMVIDPVNRDISFFGSLSSDSNKWWGGVLAADGNIYGIPYDASSILEINPVSKTVTYFTGGLNLTEKAKFIGGTLAPNGNVYCFPNKGNQILNFSVGNSRVATLSGDLSEYGGATMSKWAGSLLLNDGSVFGIAFSAKEYLKLSTTDTNQPWSLPGYPGNVLDTLSPHCSNSP